MKSPKAISPLSTFFAFICICSVLASSAHAQEISSILSAPGLKLDNPSDRARAVEQIKAIELRQLQKAQQIALKKGMPFREELPNGKVRELVGLDEDGELLYYETRNVNAAISTGADQLQLPPLSLDGSGLLVGVWDAGSVLSTHQEFNEGGSSRVNIRDGAASDDHATHVGGTIAAAGISPSAKGMVPAATIESYDWNSDTTEMVDAAATSSGQLANKVYLSNHSYGFSYGWRFSGGWIWRGTGTDQNAYDADFGQYSGMSQTLDSLAYAAPYYLIFWAAGNENNDGPSNNSTVTIGGASVTYNPSIHPQNDGDYRNGFETIGDHGVAKNLITVGAANDAVTGDLRDPAKSTIASFSSTGPTDDGRIKPDLVGNGVGLTSPIDNNDSAYGGKSGTSMASPNLTGSAALLIALYRDLFSGSAMRASTLKGLLIHTASDIGNPGPDYTYGWGLPDVKTAADLLQRQADFPDLESVVEDQLSTAQPLQAYAFTWDGISPIRATLCWTDPAGSSESAHDERTPDLVNDLNLKLIAPDGTEYFPFVMPFVGTWTVASMSQNATTGVNNVDNVEQVLVETPGQSGVWEVEVTHSGGLTNSAQEYGLIISGAGTAGALRFSASNYTVDEDVGSVTVTVNREGGATGAVSVNYATSDDSATAASDYTTTTGTLNWADGDGESKTFDIPITNDSVSETYEETLIVSLTNPVSISVTGSGSTTITIVDNETTLGVLTPNGGEALTGNSAYNITWLSSLGGDVRIELLKNDILYTTIAGTTTNDGLFEWTVPLFAPTSSDYRIRITSLGAGGESDLSNEAFAIDNQLSDVDIYSADMETDPGWTLQGDWAYGTPQGIGGQYGNPDPSSGHTGSNVIGYNLNGDYANNLGETYATTTPIDCSDFTEVQLTFYRWLNVETNLYDNARIRVSKDGTNWTQVWANTSVITDNSWTQLTYDISAVADGESTVYVRWVMGTSDGSWQYSGWNIDDVVISGLGSYANPAGEVGFSSASYTVSEGSGSATITVDRNGGTAGAISVDYSTSDGTATAGADYTAASGTLNWADGEGGPKTFSISFNNDSDREDFLESIQLTLSNTDGATILDPNPATLNIEDDENTAPSVDAGNDQIAEWQTVTVTPGLYYGTVPGNIDDTTPNPETQILVDVSSETENAIAPNTTEIYTGSIYDADGDISFTEHIDDKARIWIDGVLVLSNDTWNSRSSTGNLNLEPGWHSIEIRISNGTGGSGPVNDEIGIGYDPAGGTSWQTLADPGDGSFLRVNQDIAGASVNLDGTVNDLDEDPMSTNWSVISGPDTVDFGNELAVDTNADFIAQGTYVLRLTADDGREQTSDDVVIIVGVPLTMSIDQAAISENSGSSSATVTRLSTAGDLLVNLSSDDPSEATVPASVTILDGQTSASFTITAQDDALVDAGQTVTITASSAGYPDASATIDVTDDEVATLTLNILASSVGESDGFGATTATVTRNSVSTNELIVDLSSDDTSEADVQATVTIPAGQATSAAFAIDAIDDSLIDGTQSVNITASTAGHTDGTDTLDVTDDSSITLTVVTGAGGDSTSGGGVQDPDGSFAITATPSTNYEFVNWTVTSGSASLDDEYATETTVVASVDATIQANFGLETYTISYDGNGNDGGSAPTDQTKAFDTDLTLSDAGTLTRTGYDFDGWNTAADGSGTAYASGGTYSENTAVTLYAQWDSGPAAIYEPFNDPEASLNGNTPGFGLTGTWAGSASVIANSLNYGDLPTGIGNKASISNNYGAVSVGTSLSAAGLMDDGVSLWFSVLVTTGGDIATNGDLGFALGSEYINSGNNLPINNSGIALGFTFKNNQLRASHWAPSLTRSSDNGSNSASPESLYLVVGKFTWGATSDKLELYMPATDLTMGSVVSTYTVSIDQSTFDTISMSSKSATPAHLFDEIRFGSTYESVIGQGSSTYNVTYDGNGSDGGTVPVDNTDYDADATVTVRGNTGSLLKTGYIFTGWNTASDGSGVSYVAANSFTITEDVTLFAQWTLNTLDAWIGDYDLGDQTAPGDDFDGDGLSNIVENYFGTDPSTSSPGLSADAVTTGANTTFTFTHPINENPATDISAAYLWSKDLVNFYGSSQSDTEGTTVTFTQETVADGVVLMRATVSDTPSEKLFIRIEVIQNTP